MLYVTKEQVFQMNQEAEKAYPNECCGFMLGRLDGENHTIHEILPVMNQSEEQYHRFVITPEQMLHAELYAQKRHLDIIGFYHSHPDCPAVPSEYDRAHALPVYSYVILSVMQGAVAGLSSWVLDSADDYHTFQIEIICKQ